MSILSLNSATALHVPNNGSRSAHLRFLTGPALAAATLGMLGYLPVAAADSTLNANQDSMYNAILNDISYDIGPVPPLVLEKVLATNTGLCPRLFRESPQSGTDQAGLLDRCSALVFANSPDAKEVTLTEWTTEEATAASRNGIDFGTSQRSSLSSRLGALRAKAATGSKVAAIRPGYSRFEMSTTGGASGDEDNSLGGQLGMFVNGFYGSGSKDQTELEAAFDFDATGLTGGIDYKFTENFVAGVALGYLDSSSDFDNGSSIDTDGLSGSLFASIYGDRAFADFIATYGTLSNSAKRAIRYEFSWTAPSLVCPADCGRTEKVNTVAKGDYDGSTWALGALAGYNLGTGSWSITPMASVNYMDVGVDAYNEKGGANPELNLSVGRQEAQSFLLSIGVDVSYVASASWGLVAPYARANFMSEQETSPEKYRAKFIADDFESSTTDIFGLSNEPDDSYFVWAVGVSSVFAQGISGFAEYQSIESLDSISYWEATIGLRYEFE